MHERLRAAVGKMTYRRLGELTTTHPETVRRYMQGGAPSAEFLAHLCAALEINGDWLLTGCGPMRKAQVQEHALQGAGANDLMGAVANQLTTLIDRVERIETYMQGLDTRLRGAGTLASSDVEPHDGTRPERRSAARAKVLDGIKRALAERPSSDAD